MCVYSICNKNSEDYHQFLNCVRLLLDHFGAQVFEPAKCFESTADLTSICSSNIYLHETAPCWLICLSKEYIVYRITELYQYESSRILSKSFRLSEKIVNHCCTIYHFEISCACAPFKTFHSVQNMSNEKSDEVQLASSHF